MLRVVYDCEVFPNCFTLAAEHSEYPITWMFEISEFKDESKQLIEWLYWLKFSDGEMISFNGIGFDWPILDLLIKSNKINPFDLYQKAVDIIASQNNDRWKHIIYPSDRLVKQIDLFLLYHFDNKARATSLKALEFNMRMDNVSDLPFPVGTVLNREQVRVLREYNQHDVRATKRFYHESKKMIAFREELCGKYPDKDWINFNDTKIGKQYFEMELEKAGVRCYDYGSDGRTPRQTKRPQIVLKDAILPWIKFEQPEFQRVLDWLRQQVITETKGVFKDLVARVNGFDFVFGTGGIHGSIENERIESNEEYLIESVDVSSMYPNISIKNRFYPAHLGEKFCDIYQNLYEERKKYPKGSAENAMLKLALNGCYGDSNNPFSIFFDSLYTMKITLNGQLLICLLAEQIMKIPTAEIKMVNTDGLEYIVNRSYINMTTSVYQNWETMTGLQLEHANYKRMFIRDCNNYIGEYE